MAVIIIFMSAPEQIPQCSILNKTVLKVLRADRSSDAAYQIIYLYTILYKLTDRRRGALWLTPVGGKGGGVFVTALIDAALARAATQRRRRGAAWLLHLSVGQRGVGT
ncbi:unnamed protein product [Arctia plantaginis]|uniref:Uncharacterized protein n=1 Tax=Arctia plantaginis TaxID=874455 RepID=A0A8S1ARQ1_ARCPL|nr:unnamed protein product [Arctia plantaginis]